MVYLPTDCTYLERREPESAFTTIIAPPQFYHLNLLSGDIGQFLLQIRSSMLTNQSTG